ncbi:MAG: nuclear transport factor 2 family protein [Flavobacterium sp.]
MTNIEILQAANAAVAAGDNEGFLHYCTDDVIWEFVSNKTLKGKELIRQYMTETYIEPPKFEVENLISEGDYVTAVGNISLKDGDGKTTHYSYCDVWRFSDGKMAELKAFVIKK